MDNVSKVLIGFVAVFAFAVGGYASMHRPVAPAQPMQQAPRAGAVSGPDIPSPYFSVGGQRQWMAHPQFLTGSSTLCGIQSPAATTTLEFFSAIGRTGPYAYEYTLSWGATQNASTTRLAQGWVGSEGQGEIVATSTIGIGGTTLSKADNVIPPNTWLMARVGTTSATAASATFAPTGTCGLMLIEL